MYYFQKYFGDHVFNSFVTGSTNVVAYASRFSSGQAGIVVVNKGTAAETVALNLQNFGYGDRFYLYSLTGGTDNGNFSLKVFVNGQGTTYAAGGPANVESIPALSATTQNGVIVSAPGRSVQYILVENGNNGPLGFDKVEKIYARVSPNPSQNQFTIHLPYAGFSTVELLDHTGKIIFKQPVSDFAKEVELTTQLTPGFYLAKVYSKNKIVLAKVLIR